LAAMLAPRGDLFGPKGDLAVLKCLLNECPEYSNSELPLFVEFSTEQWREEFLKANYIFGPDGESEGEHDDSGAPCIVPSLVNKALLKDAGYRKSPHPFRWEILDQVDFLTKHASELDHDMWRQLGRISEAIKRADQKSFFLNNEGEHILLAPEYDLLNRMSEHGELNGFVVAFEKAIACFGRDEDVLERLIEVASQFQFADLTKFKAYVEKKITGNTDVDIVERVAYKFLGKLKASTQDQALDTSSILKLFEKLETCRDSIPVEDEGLTARSTTRIRQGNPSGDSPTTRRFFTKEEDDAIRKGVDEYGEGMWASIKIDPRFEGILSNRTNMQIKDRYRTMKKNMERAEDGNSTPRKKRRNYSNEEDNAILNGVEMYRRGNSISWKEILTDPNLGPKLKHRDEMGIRKRWEKVLQYNLPAFRELY
jgi:F0F1-type ATP synthase delta subunit